MQPALGCSQLMPEGRGQPKGNRSVLSKGHSHTRSWFPQHLTLQESPEATARNNLFYLFDLTMLEKRKAVHNPV